MKTYAFTLGLLLLPLTTACDAKEECIADCGGTDVGTGSSESGTNEESSSSGGAAVSCEVPTEAADAFVEANRACETLLDCTSVLGLCYPNAGDCGAVALSTDADLAEWEAIDAELSDACPCGADPCGAREMCNDAQQCEAVFLSDAYCPSVERDIQTFLDANRACDTDEDCVAVDSTCYVDECSVVALNVDASAQDWQTLDGALASCDLEEGNLCNYVGECAPAIRCGDDGQCIAEF